MRINVTNKWFITRSSHEGSEITEYDDYKDDLRVSEAVTKLRDTFELGGRAVRFFYEDVRS